MIDIPRDIWLHIADFIPEPDLHGMITLNSTSVFFELGMEARYREVSISYLGDKIVRKRVRLMQVQLLLVQPLLIFNLGILQWRSVFVT